MVISCNRKSTRLPSASLLCVTTILKRYVELTEKMCLAIKCSSWQGAQKVSYTKNLRGHHAIELCRRRWIANSGIAVLDDIVRRGDVSAFEEVWKEAKMPTPSPFKNTYPQSSSNQHPPNTYSSYNMAAQQGVRGLPQGGGTARKCTLLLKGRTCFITDSCGLRLQAESFLRVARTFDDITKFTRYLHASFVVCQEYTYEMLIQTSHQRCHRTETRTERP